MEPILYKKKITTIVKEYYKIHENGNGNGNGDLYKVSPDVYSTNGVVSSYPPGQPPEFDRTTFTDSVISYFESYGKKLQDVINASTGTEDELNAAEENAFKDIWAIGVLLRPFYTAEFSERLTHMLRSILLLELQIVAFSKMGYDTKTWTDRISNLPVSDMARMLSTYNEFFNRDNIRSHWTIITDSWLNAVKAKVAKDTVKFDENIKRANDHLKAFASYLAQGVIQQHSSRFFEPSLTV